MRIERSFNADDIHSILRHPEIYPLISHDGAPSAEEFIVNPEQQIFALGYVEDVPVGCVILHPRTALCWQVHFQVLPEYRKQYALSMGQEGLEWAWENTTAIKLVAEVPQIYSNVTAFALKQGFQIEGTNRKSTVINGEIIDSLLLGISKWDL